MVQVTITEMYDMSTVQNKIAVFGIHTPSMGSVSRRWHGLMVNHKWIRVVKCDLSIACASVLPADPLQVGVGSDQIAPQDMMNPILYRAVSNDAWNAVVNRVFQPASQTGGFSAANGLRYSTDAFSGLSAENQEKLYYALLAEGGWRKAMPQAGLSMKNLVPIVYPVLSTYGNTNADGSALPSGLISNQSGTAQSTTSANGNNPITFRGHAQPMPRVPCSAPGSMDPSSLYPEFNDGTIPRTYVACILMPPNKSGNVLYFRLVLTWTLEFTGLVTAIEKEQANHAASGNYGIYNRTYDFPSSKLADVATEDDLTVDSNSIESMNGNIDLVMEK